MKVLFLIQDFQAPSAKFRVLQYLPYLREKGVIFKVESMPKGLRKRLKLFRSAKEFDLVFLQKRLLQSWQLERLRGWAKKIIYDFDDAIMYRDSNSPNQISWWRERQFKQMVENVNLVIAGNEYLMKQAWKYTENVSILPTPIDTTRYAPKDGFSQNNQGTPSLQPSRLRREGRRKLLYNPVTLGWMGSKSTLIYLKDLIPVLQSLAERFNNIQLKIVGDDFFDCPPLLIMKKPWKEKVENSDLQSFDIGLAPLRDDSWSRGKCGFKILQYMAVGVSVVLSPIGANRDLVEDGREGFWAETEDEWMEKLALLINKADLRKRMGLSGREKVIKLYSLNVNAPRLVAILENCLAR